MQKEMPLGIFGSGTRRKTDVKQLQKVLNDNAHMDRPSRNFASSPTMPPKPIVRPSSTLYTRLWGGKNVALTLEGLFDGFWLNMLMYPAKFSREESIRQVLAYLEMMFAQHFANQIL